MRALLLTALALLSPVAVAQHAGHASPAPQDAPVDHSRMDHSQVDHATPAQETPVDHSRMDHSQVDHATPAQETPVDHSQMDHSQVDHATPAQETPVDHSQMDHTQMDHATPAQTTPADHTQMDHARHGAAASTQPRTPVPVLTDADRAVVFPGSHSAHDDAIHSFVLVDRFEATDGDHGRGHAWEVQAWIGKDVDRLWLRSEGERAEGRTEGADVELLYGRAISPWWDLVAGVRHDFKPGDPQSHLAIGVMGMAPYKFEVEATAYLGESGDLSARLEAEYDTLLTNRLVLQWLAEAGLHGKDDPGRGIGSGLSTIEAGLRLRYEIRREFAPYVGVVRERAFGGTADLRREHGEPVDDTLVVAGVRFWF